MHPKKKNKNPVRPTILALWKRKQTKQNKVTLFLEIYSIIPETIWYSSVFVNIISLWPRWRTVPLSLKSSFYTGQCLSPSSSLSSMQPWCYLTGRVWRGTLGPRWGKGFASYLIMLQKRKKPNGKGSPAYPGENKKDEKRKEKKKKKKKGHGPEIDSSNHSPLWQWLCRWEALPALNGGTQNWTTQDDEETFKWPLINFTVSLWIICRPCMHMDKSLYGKPVCQASTWINMYLDSTEVLSVEMIAVCVQHHGSLCLLLSGPWYPLTAPQKHIIRRL